MTRKQRNIEQDKKIVMITGVTFFMVLIISFWLLNIKNTFQLDSTKVSENNFNWAEMKKGLNDITVETKKSIKEIKNLQQTASSSLPQTNQVEEKNIGLLKERLMNKVNN
ncbi:MAG: hypothetical protein ABIJ83_03070 [Patescibacteria group bacterium]|nr:hypothetical protein [Patescibacteria group bacterium]MBU1062632.1 hypothetical protein [Patescibacteria group bacterium]